ncbi:MAG TPA: STM4015 family protein [Candidatus Stackebrandtia excrementipullorum]|nr:STM4015 family protein [Candidatus Stackebrandtia excrementipullorum]
MNTEHLTDYAGLPVVDFPFSNAVEGPRPQTWEDEARHEQEGAAALDRAKEAPASVAWRLRSVEDAADFPSYVERFVREVDTRAVTALVVGDWGLHHDVEVSFAAARDALIAHVAAFPALRSMFLGDVTYEECEISWLEQCDMAPLLAAYPNLVALTTRGVDGIIGKPGLALHVPEHTGLRSLTVQTGGLPGRVTREIVSSGLPNLERLELWLGQEEYGGDTTIDDLRPVLSGDAFGGLVHLGLRNAENTGDLLKALVESSLLPRLRSVDLSMGTLRGRDVELLLTSIPKLAHLDDLNFEHHYLTKAETERVQAAFDAAGVSIDLSEPQEAVEYDGTAHFYPAVGE